MLALYWIGGSTYSRDSKRNGACSVLSCRIPTNPVQMHTQVMGSYESQRCSRPGGHQSSYGWERAQKWRWADGGSPFRRSNTGTRRNGAKTSQRSRRHVERTVQQVGAVCTEPCFEHSWHTQGTRERDQTSPGGGGGGEGRRRTVSLASVWQGSGCPTLWWTLMPSREKII